MANTITVKCRDRAAHPPDAPFVFTNTLEIDRQFSFTDSLSSLHKAKGVAFDGTFLWFSTTGAAARKPYLIMVDLVSGAEVKTVQCTEMPSNSDILDIVFDGEFFYALEFLAGIPNIWRVRKLTKTGKVIKTAFTLSGSPLGWRALAYDGYFVYVTRCDPDFGGLGYNDIEKWDPTNGAKIGEFATTILGYTGCGLVFTGYQFIAAGDELYPSWTFHEFVISDATGTILMDPVRTNITKEAKAPSAAAAQEAMTYDGRCVVGFSAP